MTAIKHEMIHTWQEAAELTIRCGLLPLTPLIPDHPSLSGSTPSHAWHSGKEDDPWLWRVTLAETGAAAYLKLIKGKAVFVAPELFGLLHGALTGHRSPAQRYADGLLSRDAMRIYEVIAESGFIDARTLREASGMKAKEMKPAYDRALQELQASADLVIAGVHEKRNRDGEVSGWSSALYQPAVDWLAAHELELMAGEANETRALLREHLQQLLSPEAYRYLAKYWRLPV